MSKIKGIYKKDEEGNWQEYKKVFLKFTNEEKNKDRISMMTFAGYTKLKKDKIKGFCHHKFKANFVIEELNLDKITLDSRLTVGEALVKVIGIGKTCHKECPALTSGNKCTLGRHIFFGRVLQSGKVEYDDLVEL